MDDLTGRELKKYPTYQPTTCQSTARERVYSRILYSRSLCCNNFCNKLYASDSYSFIFRLIPYPQNSRLQLSQFGPQRRIPSILASTQLNTTQTWGVHTIVEIELDKLDYYTKHNFSLHQNHHRQLMSLKNLRFQKQPSPL